MSNWIIFTGHNYEKRYYDVRLKNGEVFEHCWPNAGGFHHGVNYIQGIAVLEIRESATQ